MKEKSVVFSSGWVSPGGGKSVPSVESMSVLDRSKLVLLWSLEKSWWSAREAASVCEDSEDGWLLGGCFLVEMPSFSKEGDSGTKLQMKTMESERQMQARTVWITHTQQMIEKGRTETSTKGMFGGSRYQQQGCGSLSLARFLPTWIYSVLNNASTDCNNWIVTFLGFLLPSTKAPLNIYTQTRWGETARK